MADNTSTPPPLPSQSQQSTSSSNHPNPNPNRSRGRRPPRRPREDTQASAESLAAGPSEGQAAGEAASSSRPTNSNTNRQTHSGHQRNEGGPSRSNRGRGRGNRGGPRQNSRPEARTEEQSTTTPTTTPAESSSSRGTTARQRARRGGSFVPGGRQFGGQLTKAEPAPESHTDDNEPTIHAESSSTAQPSSSSTAQPNTIIIESGPSDPHRPKRHRQRHNHHNQPKTVREAEDLTSRIHAEIASADYECMICYSSVTRKSKIWDCTRCYAVFHLHCIKKWAHTALDVPTPSNDEIVPQRTWRCPGCQNPSVDAPDGYTCWCGKSENPEVARYVPPHSCGQTCGKQRGGEENSNNNRDKDKNRSCPHGCDLQCHAGPCPPCSSMGPSQPCFCGKEVSQKRCVDTDYENGWSCGHVCGDLMPCGEHTCERRCHGGVCGACEVTELLKCYCGQEEKEVKCCDKLDGRVSFEVLDGVETVEERFWKCERTCDRVFDCGEHKCQKGCHVRDVEVPHCPFSPDVVKFCPCGKTELETENPRTKCTDPIPHCDKVCSKKLPCGHECEMICHTGDCGACCQKVELVCRCGNTSAESLCHQGVEGEAPWCKRICHTTMNCLRHECGQHCCAGEQKAKERMHSKKKVVVRGRAEDIEPEHICTRICGKPLKCGLHDCGALCHRGACGTCLEANFDELACHCGRTRIMPPVPCGTKPPSCRFPCQRSKPCGHPNATDHLCHLDDEPCPKCPYLVQKRCVCGRNNIKNQPCWRDSVSCGQTCGKPLSCGSHVCLKTCHAAGECEEPCRQTCKKSRAICGHDCQDACHAPFACSVESPCPAKITLTCPCGNVRQDITCNTSSRNQNPKRAELKCIDDCRRRQLAAAFNIDMEKRAAEEAINSYSDETLEFYLDNRVWCAGIEKMMREFCDDKGKVRLAFKPMKSHLRAFIHGLAEDYGLDSESEDPEPYRSVVVTKNGRWSMPSKGLAEAVRARKAEAAAAAATPATAGTGIQQLRKTTGLQAVNAILLGGLRVGLLTSELEKELGPTLKQSTLRFGIRWYGDEEVLLEPLPSSFSMDEVEVELGNVKVAVKRHCTVNRIASSVDLCWVGRDGKVANKEGQAWNVVSTGKGAKASTTTGAAGGGSYANLFGVLRDGPGGSFAAVSAGPKGGLSVKSDVAKAKNKVLSPVVPKEEPVDDWLEAMENEEREAEAEKAAASGAASSVEDNGGQQSGDEGEREKEELAVSTTV
ncbi:FKBP12-associated protein [Orbilia ellipsospora]|uniref:FKBP12-associated protein n=1 Tax=Orbilia ellipsospora TaxID=2528407 RepID=A0AAV9X7X0_9PEZI